MPSGYTHPLPAEGPLFEPWVMPSEPVSVYRSIVNELDDSLYANKDFIPDTPTSELLLVPHLFLSIKMGRRSHGNLKMLGVILYFQYFLYFVSVLETMLI